MSTVSKKILTQLKKKNQVNDFFYPNISMDVDLPNGLDGEITDITRLLEKTGFQLTTENVLKVMKFKRDLICKYTQTSEGKLVLEEYNNVLLEHVKPIGISIPLELLFSTGLITVVLFVISRFLGSFADESGKIVARKLLNNDKHNSKELNMTIEEFWFLKDQIIILIGNGNDLDSLSKELQRKKE